MSDAVTVVLEHLQAENQQLSEELLKQFEIATSLKQLVVAATGGDLQQRIVEMERENIELRQELGRLCEQLPQLAAQTRSALRRERQQSTGIVAALLRAIDAADESSMKEARRSADDFLESHQQSAESFLPRNAVGGVEGDVALDCCSCCTGELKIV